MESERANKTIRVRMKVLMVIFGFLLFIPLITKLYKIQIVDHEKLEELAIEQQTQMTKLSASRGTIYDRNNNVLAFSATAETIYIDPKNIQLRDDAEETAEFIAKNLSEIFGLEYEKILEKTKKNNHYEIIIKKVEKELGDKVRKLIQDNTYQSLMKVAPDSVRYYPLGNFASNVIGFIGTDNYGLEGVEAKYESVLKGTSGQTVVAKGNKNTSMPYEFEMYYDAINGQDLILTIDSNLQHFLEKNLDIAVTENNVTNRASGIIMDVKTGAVLAMSTKGDYDLNNPRELVDLFVKQQIEEIVEPDEKAQKLVEAQQSQWRNKAISDAYEPGSTFKIMTLSMALEENVLSDSDNFNCTGMVHIGGFDIRCHKKTGHGAQNYVEAILHSCNPAFIAIGNKVGPDKFWEYMKAFGFMDKTDIDLPGETQIAPPLIHTETQFKTTATTQATYAFGQTFKTTPIQLITAVSCVANGGNLMKPYVVQQTLDNDKKVVYNASPTVVRQVISKETSRKMCEILEEAVKSGTGSNAYVKGYRIAGKTGTSQKIDLGQVAKDKGWYVTSFVGFAPADDPQIAILIMLDQPELAQRALRTGGYTAAPVARRIFADALPYLGVAPQYTPEEITGIDMTTPSIKNLTVEAAKTTLDKAELKYEIIGVGETVTDQIPAAGVSMPSGAKIILYTEGEKPNDKVIVPDVVGKSPEQANKALADAGLYMKTVGAQSASGSPASWQDLVSGIEVLRGTIVQVEFRSTARDDSTGY